MKKNLLFLTVIALAAFFHTSAQTLDQSFRAPLPIRAAEIKMMKRQPDGKILLGGDIVFYGTKRVHNLIRINADGSLDETFSFPGNDLFMVTHMEVLASGEIVALARRFDFFSSVYLDEAKIVKLHADGSLNKEIVVATNTVGALAVTGDGKILTVGSGGLKRYNADLTLDAAFSSSFSANGAVTAIAVTGDKVLVAGRFSSVNGVTKNDIVRLNADGSVDNSFDTGSGTEDNIGEMTLQPDGKILLGRCFINSFNGTQRRGLARLNADGSVDAGFNPPSLNGPLGSVLVTNDGMIYAAAFFVFDGTTEDRLFRLKPDGSLDYTFKPVLLDDFGAIEFCMAFSGGNLIINHSQEHGNVYGLSRINTGNGSYDNTFSPPVSRYGTITIVDILGGRMLVAGDFIRLNGIETYGIGRLSLNGTVDQSFRLKKNKGAVQQLKVLNDTSVLVSTYKNFFKLDAEGNERPDFSWKQFKNLYQIIKFIVLPDGKIMAADANGMYRMNADASEDPSFSVGGLGCWVSTAFDFDMQDDKIIYGSAFCSLGDVQVNRLARLMPNGAVDPLFHASGAGPDENVTLVKVLDNNEVLVGGFFDTFDGKPERVSLVKLSASGVPDEVFHENLKTNYSVQRDIAFSKRVVQFDSTIYFQTYRGIYALALDGSAADFTIPADVKALANIIAYPDPDAPGGRTKSESGHLYAFGSFRTADSESPSFILKMKIGNPVNTDPDPDPDTDTDPDPDTDPDDLVTGTEEPGRNAFSASVYPNPVNGKLSVSVDEPDGVFQVAVFDLSGRKYAETRVDISDGTNTSDLDLDHMPAGLYVLKLASEKGKSTFIRFSKVN